MKQLRAIGFGMALVAAWPLAVLAQQRGGAPAPAVAPSDAALVPLKVRVTVSRYQGQKQLARLPFTLAVNANDRKPANVVAATQVLIPMLTAEGKTVGPVYKDVGSKIECVAVSLDGGRFKLDLTVEDALLGTDDQAVASAQTSAPWRIRAFRSEQSLILRDGQTMEYTSATDKSTGEDWKIEVALTVVK